MSSSLPPPLTPPSELQAALRQPGYAVLDAGALCELVGVQRAQLDALRPFWGELPPDQYLRDGGRYRHRRHSCFIVDGERVTQVPHRSHWQPLEYNALHGGIERWFEPIDPAMLAQPAWGALLRGLAATWSALAGVQPWYVEAHPFRIDTADGIGRPTPEGAHRDGVDFVAVLLVGRDGIKGGETRVFDAGGPRGVRFTMDRPWTGVLLDDAHVIHETTPIQPLGEHGHRDTLVLTFRAGGFQGPALG